MTHQIKTSTNKILVELKVVEHGTEFYTSKELSEFKQKLNEANKDHGKQFNEDLSTLDKIYQECKKTGVNPDVITKHKFSKVSKNWGLKYENN